MSKTFWAARESDRIAVLKELLTRLQSVDVREMRDDVAFQSILVESQRILELSDAQIADGLLMSRPTVNRWMHGRNLPHIGVRKPILNWFVADLKRRIGMLQTPAPIRELAYASAID